MGYDNSSIIKIIATYYHADSPSFFGHSEVGKSYFGVRRIKAMRYRGAIGKIVFG